MEAPRIRLCACIDKAPFEEVSFSPFAELLPDRCTPELRRLQAELGAWHSFREAARLLAAFLPCSPATHASIRNRLHRVAAAVEDDELGTPPATKECREVTDEPDDGVTVLIDGAHIRATPGHQTRHLDVIVGKVEAPGRKPRRFALAPLAAERPLAQIRAALTEQGWTKEGPVTVISDGEAAYRNWFAEQRGATSITSWTGGTSPCEFVMPSRRWPACMRSSPFIAAVST